METNELALGDWLKRIDLRYFSQLLANHLADR
jgi:hypothetical protein